MKKTIYSALLALACMVTTTGYAQKFSEQTEAHRKAYKEAFISDNHSPLTAADTASLSFFEADSKYAVLASVELLENQIPFTIPTFDGQNKVYTRFARLRFSLNGKQLALTLYKSQALAASPIYKDYLFLPFTDLTNGKSTYTGGRYLDLNVQDIKLNTLKLDFNKAYNPYCAYSDGYHCPVPPAENDLKMEVLAGEKSYRGSKKKK